MKWKCINDLFGYCSGEPDGASKAYETEVATGDSKQPHVKVKLGLGATCSLNPKTCGKRQSFEVVCPPSPSEWIEPEVLVATKPVVVEQPAPPKPKPTVNKGKEKQAQLL